MVVAEEDVFHAELKILFKLIGQWSDTAGVIKIIWFEAGEDDFVFMAVPNERAKDGMGFAELFEEVEGDGDIFGRAEHWVAKGDVDDALAKFGLGNSVWRVAGPDERVGIGEFSFALIEIEVNVFAEKVDDFGIGGLQFWAREDAVIIRIQLRNPLQNGYIKAEFGLDFARRDSDAAVACVRRVSDGGQGCD